MPIRLGADMGCEPHRLSSIGPRRGATSRDRAGCKFVSSIPIPFSPTARFRALAPGSSVPGLASAQVAWRRLNCRRAALLATMALVAVTAFAPGAARAQDATWLLNPASGNFNTAANWNPATVPTGTAFFGTSNTTALTFSAPTTVGGWTFNAGASAYTFANNQALQFNGAGISLTAAALPSQQRGGVLNSSTSARRRRTSPMPAS